jgi:hypothetical protein
MSGESKIDEAVAAILRARRKLEARTERRALEVDAIVADYKATRARTAEILKTLPAVCAPCGHPVSEHSVLNHRCMADRCPCPGFPALWSEARR